MKAEKSAFVMGILLGLMLVAGGKWVNNGGGSKYAGRGRHVFDWLYKVVYRRWPLCGWINISRKGDDFLAILIFNGRLSEDNSRCSTEHRGIPTEWMWRCTDGERRMGRKQLWKDHDKIKYFFETHHHICSGRAWSKLMILHPCVSLDG